MAEARPTPIVAGAEREGRSQAEPLSRERNKTTRAGLAAVLCVVLLAGAVSYLLIAQKRADLLAELESRLTVLAENRAEAVGDWVRNRAAPIDRIAGSDLFRLFATEVKIAFDEARGAGGGLALSDDLLQQIPFMERVLSDFSKDAGFTSGYLLGPDHQAKVASAGSAALSDGQRQLAARAQEAALTTLGALRENDSGLVLDIAVPVLPAQASSDETRAIGAMLFTATVAGELAELLKPRPGAQPGETVGLLQGVGERTESVHPGQTPALRPFSNKTTQSVVLEIISFGLKETTEAGRSAYRVGVPVPVTGAAWWVLQEQGAAAAERSLMAFRAYVLTVAALLVIAALLVLGAFWWRLSSHYNGALADQYQVMAAQLAEQKQLLDRINASISEHVALKAGDGTYRYVNPAFARLFNRSPEAVVGLDDEALFGQATAQRLLISDRTAMEDSVVVTLEEKVYIADRLHYLQFCKAPYSDDEGRVGGVVSVSRDTTELVEQRAKREKAVKQTIAALVLAIETRDPYLAGHSRRVGEFAMAIAEQAGAGADELSTLAIASDLCQIGKLAVPREVLAKPARLDEPELAVLREHVTHAASLLRDIDFGFPVLETISQMHERIDGAGYPHGLLGHEISRTAQILGLSDVFCARVEPRGHREGIAAAEALAILESNSERYDPALVAALRRTLDSAEGKQLVDAIPLKQLAQ